MENSGSEELRREVEDLRNFLYRLTHDLQEPIRAVSSFSSLALKFPSEAPAHLERVRAHALRMDTLVRTTLEYLQRTTIRDAVPTGPVSLKSALDRAVGALQHVLDQACAVVLCQDLPTVQGDLQQLSELFENLIGNAVKYRGSNLPAIKITAAVNEGVCTVAVSDNGPGIDPKYFDLIFKPFERLQRAAPPGAGLGLAICRHIVERHHGRIWVESTPGYGATFLFTLPV